MISGLPQVCIQWLGVIKGILSLKHLPPKIIKVMAFNYCGCQLARSLGWVAPAYNKKEGATPHPGVGKFSLQYDCRPDVRFGVRVGAWNLGSLSGNGGEVCEQQRKRIVC